MRNIPFTGSSTSVDFRPMPKTASIVRFGGFELDLETADLRRDGSVVRLREQQFQILKALLLRKGGVVTREELRTQLWPSGIVVEFDRSINTAVMKLRDALEDTADKPKYVETLPRRGYRIVVPVHFEEDRPAPPPALILPSIAVLPFEDLSPDRSQQPFCEGMAAEIINALGGVAGLRVISRTSAVLCREKGMELGEIGQHLGVQSVLEGTVRKSGARLRVTAHLVSTHDGSQTWSKRYDRDEGDVFEIQDEITEGIVQSLKGKLFHSAPGIRRSTESLEAYKLYLKGRYYWERRNRAYLQAAMLHFDQAIAADSEYALPHSGLADCFLIMAVYSFRAHHEAYPKALALARRALQLDPDLAEAHLSLGAIQVLLEHDWVHGEASLSRALALDPRLAVARAYRALLYAVTGRAELAKAEALLCIPDDPDSGLICYVTAATHFCAGDLEASAELIERALDLEPKAILIHWIRSWIYSLSGRAEAAITESLKAAIASDHHQMLVAGLGVAYARAGRTAEAEELIAELQERSAHECIASQWIGEIYLALNRYTDALDYFERAFTEKNSFLLALASAPQYFPLKHEPRYKTLLQKMNLVPSAAQSF